MKTTYLFFALLTTLFVDAQNTRVVQKFTKIDVSTSVSVKIVKADYYKLEYKMVKGGEEGFVVKQAGENLKLTTKSSGMWSGNNISVNVTLYTPTLKSIEVSSGGSVVSQDKFNADEMFVAASSGASIDLALNVNKLNVEVSSGGSIVTTGTSKKTKVDASSGGSFKAYDLCSDIVEAEASSGGTIKVQCNITLTADASSGGSINYKGEPSNKNVNAGFSGSIKKVD